MLKKLLKRLKGDIADSVMIPFIIAMPLLLIVFGLGFDTAKNIWIKSTYASSAQAAVDAGVKTLNSKGSLTNKSVEKVVAEFKSQNSASTSHTREGAVYESKTCSTAVIDGKTKTLPYYEISLGSARGNGVDSTSPVWKIEGTAAVPKKTLPTGSKYRVMTADIYTASNNSWLSMAGKPCQVYKSSVSAIAFGSNADLNTGPDHDFPVADKPGLVITLPTPKPTGPVVQKPYDTTIPAPAPPGNVIDPNLN